MAYRFFVRGYLFHREIGWIDHANKYLEAMQFIESELEKERIEQLKKLKRRK